AFDHLSQLGLALLLCHCLSARLADSGDLVCRVLHGWRNSDSLKVLSHGLVDVEIVRSIREGRSQVAGERDSALDGRNAQGLLRLSQNRNVLNRQINLRQLLRRRWDDWFAWLQSLPDWNRLIQHHLERDID